MTDFKDAQVVSAQDTRRRVLAIVAPHPAISSNGSTSTSIRSAPSISRQRSFPAATPLRNCLILPVCSPRGS
jgi:hypothetical protein